MKDNTRPLGFFRSYFWPIERHEVATILPMALMLFLICVCHGLLRASKDALVVTAEHSSAAVIPFLKVWGILPMAIVGTMVFTWLSGRFSRERVFYLITTSFLSFFLIFTFVLYPLREQLHLHHFADWLTLHLPSGAKGFISMIRYWSFSAYYILAELWGSLVMAVLFWGFANEVTRVSQGRRFYCVLTVASNLACVAAGGIGLLLTQEILNPRLPFGSTAWEQSLILVTLTLTVAGLATMGLYRYLAMHELPLPGGEEAKVSMVKKEKPRLSLVESFQYLLRSRYLLSIAVLVLSYNLIINLVETPWKEQLRLLYPEEARYNRFMSLQNLSIGLLSTFLALPLSEMIHRFGWTTIALLTPIGLLITSVGFFTFLLLGQSMPGDSILFLGFTPLAVGALFGTVQNCLAKATKYSLFDSTKEIAFIPLPSDVKLQGKAAIDGIGSRFAKSASSLFQQGLFLSLGSVAAITPFIAVAVFGLIWVWIRSVKSLGQQYQDLLVSKEKRETNEKEESQEAERLGVTA